MFRISRAVIVFLLMAIFLPGDSIEVNAQSIPRAIRNNYPEDRFIVRFGSGEKSESAADNARFEITKYFESKISGETLVREWAQTKTTRGKTIENQLTEFSNTIMIGSSRDIPGIEIVSNEYDKKAKIYEAWAVLEKGKYIATLLDRVKNIDSKVEYQLANIPDGDLNRIRISSQVISDLILREQSLLDLSLLESGAGITSENIVLYRVMSSLDSLIADAFDVGVVYENEIDSKVKAGIVKGISDAGIRIREYADVNTAAEDGIDLLITVEHSVTSRSTSSTINNREFNFFFASWVLSIQAKEPDTQDVITTYVRNDETNGGNAAQALDRMTNKILREQVPAVSKWVYDSILKPE